jgi:hypothetical protein
VLPPDAKDLKVTTATNPEHAHVGNWLDCMRSRKTPNCPIQAGYAHMVACALGREAERTGRRMRYDSMTRRIVEADGGTH